MILQNLSRAVREQNYYAVVLEFVIVIAGVVIGFQITQIAQAGSEERRAEELLSLVAAEMRTNLEIIRTHAGYLETEAANLVELRTGLAEFGPQSDTDRLEFLISQAVSDRLLQLDTAALDQLDEAAAKRFIQGSAAEAAIQDWRGMLGALQRTEVSLTSNTDIDWQATYPALSFEAVSYIFPSPGLAERVPPRFESDWAALAQSADLAGRLSVITVNTEYAWLYTNQLEQRTTALIEVLEADAQR